MCLYLLLFFLFFLKNDLHCGLFSIQPEQSSYTKERDFSLPIFDIRFVLSSLLHFKKISHAHSTRTKPASSLIILLTFIHPRNKVDDTLGKGKKCESGLDSETKYQTWIVKSHWYRVRSTDGIKGDSIPATQTYLLEMEIHKDSSHLIPLVYYSRMLPSIFFAFFTVEFTSWMLEINYSDLCRYTVRY